VNKAISKMKFQHECKTLTAANSQSPSPGVARSAPTRATHSVAAHAARLRGPCPHHAAPPPTPIPLHDPGSSMARTPIGTRQGTAFEHFPSRKRLCPWRRVEELVPQWFTHHDFSLPSGHLQHCWDSLHLTERHHTSSRPEASHPLPQFLKPRFLEIPVGVTKIHCKC